MSGVRVREAEYDAGNRLVADVWGTQALRGRALVTETAR
jgi:hypothetical protein